MRSIQTTITGFSQYRGREGHLSFILHRLTGLGTLLFLAIHILDTSTVYFFPSLYSHAIEIYRSTPFMIGEIILVFSVIFHGVNGVRIAVFDLFLTNWWKTSSQRATARWTLAIAVLLWIPAAYLMLRSLLANNFNIHL
jgi:succinate dehydrogenase / fumarate reductase cytochrome b subunit